MTRKRIYLFTPIFLTSILGAVLMLLPTLAQASGSSFIGGFNTVSTIVSTVPKKWRCQPLWHRRRPTISWSTGQRQRPGQQL